MEIAPQFLSAADKRSLQVEFSLYSRNHVLLCESVNLILTMR